MTAVKLSHLAKSYSPGTSALHDLSLDIPAGRITALLGPSGCGKTTALKIIAGLIPPSSGDVLFDGRSVLPMPPEARSAVMVFQNPLLFPYMSVARNVGFGLRLRGQPQTQIDAAVADMLAAVRLPDHGIRNPADLSGGEAQRVALARALVLNPRVLLLDEPLSSLDPHLRGDMRDLIRELQARSRVTTLIVTHDQDEAVALADGIALLIDGRLRQFAPPQDFFQRPADLVTARFFGGCNFIPGTASGTSFISDLPPLTLPPGTHQGPGTLTFRPEALRPGPGPRNTFTARISRRTFQGTRTRLTLTAGSHTLTADLAPGPAADAEASDSFTCHLPPEALWVLPPEPQG
jgi:putative spermidine/putrescine transport system ATP-binding protein